MGGKGSSIALPHSPFPESRACSGSYILFTVNGIRDICFQATGVQAGAFSKQKVNEKTHSWFHTSIVYVHLYIWLKG